MKRGEEGGGEVAGTRRVVLLLLTSQPLLALLAALIEAMPVITGGPGVPKAPPFLSPAILHSDSNTLYLSGQCGVDLEGNFIEGSVADRTKQTMRNIAAVLKAAGMGLEDSSFLSCSPGGRSASAETASIA